MLIRDIRAVPVFRLLVGLVVGIMISRQIQASLTIILSGLFLFNIMIAAAYFGRIVKKPGHEWVVGLLIMFLYILIGLLAYHSADMEQEYPTGNYSGTFVAKVLNPPVIKEKTIRLEVQIIDKIDTGIKWCNGIHTIVYIESSGIKTYPCFPDKFVFRGELRKPESPANPGEFNYAGFLKSKKIFFVAYIKSDDWRIIGRDAKFSIMKFAIQTREWLWNKISSVEPENPNLNVLYALALGARDLLDKETTESYAASGTTHVLSVSGLHVGLIWMIISRILLFLKRIPFGNHLYLFFGFILLWLYALITGMSPPVVRSTIMFSLIILAKEIHRETSIFNSIFIAAFFSLVFMPDWLYNAGFQLSYSAVFGIVFFQPKIVALFSSRFRLVKWLWELTAVSLAAQLGTISISIYYFHRFPPYFLPANLFVIPLVTIILAFFLLQVVTVLLPVIFVFISKLVFFLVGIMNFIVKIVGNLPAPNYLDCIFLSREQMWLLIVIIILTGIFIRYRYNLSLVINIFCLLLFILIGNIRIWNRDHNEFMVVYKVSNDFVVGMYSKGKGVLFINTNDHEGIYRKLNTCCSGFHYQHSVISPEIIFFDSPPISSNSFVQIIPLPGEKNYFCRFMNKRIILLNDPSCFNSTGTGKTLIADYIIIGGRRKIDEEIFLKRFSCERLIMSSSIPSYIRENFPRNISGGSELIFDCRVNGAWILSRKL